MMERWHLFRAIHRNPKFANSSILIGMLFALRFRLGRCDDRE
jgi:hypothetical protein